MAPGAGRVQFLQHHNAEASRDEVSRPSICTSYCTVVRQFQRPPVRELRDNRCDQRRCKLPDRHGT